MVFIVEDQNGNKFGEYFPATLDKIHCKTKPECARDPQSFLFSLKSNGRLKGMMKFESKKEGGAWIELYKHDEIWDIIIDFGNGDLTIGKYPRKDESCCNRNPYPQYDFHSIEYPLRGNKDLFTPIRFIVVQMI